jgi:hypothetical protein
MMLAFTYLAIVSFLTVSAVMYLAFCLSMTLAGLYYLVAGCFAFWRQLNHILHLVHHG